MLKKILLYLLFGLGLFFLLVALASATDLNQPGTAGAIVISLIIGLPSTIYSYKKLFPKELAGGPMADRKAEESDSHTIQKQSFLKNIRVPKYKFLYLFGGILFLWLLWPVDQNLPGMFYGTYDRIDRDNQVESISIHRNQTYSCQNGEGTWKLRSRSGTSPDDWKFTVKFYPTENSGVFTKSFGDGRWDLDVEERGPKRDFLIPHLSNGQHFRLIDQKLPEVFYGKYHGIYRSVSIERDGIFTVSGTKGKWRIQSRHGSSSSNWRFDVLFSLPAGSEDLEYHFSNVHYDLNIAPKSRRPVLHTSFYVEGYESYVFYDMH
jgi:hypothetical protein